MQANGKPLHNIGVLVTRPAHQAGHFIQLLQQAGATAIEFPAIEIDQPDNTETVQARIAQLDDYDLVIFISSNAVEYGLKFMQQAGKRLLNPVAAIGRSTASCLQRHNIAVSVQPENGFNSEALLASKALQAAQVKGKKVLIVRGQGGLELLANSLQQRGARVDPGHPGLRRAA